MMSPRGSSTNQAAHSFSLRDREEAADRLKMKTYGDSNHCDFPLPFDLSEFSSTVPCHMDTEQCALVEAWVNA